MHMRVKGGSDLSELTKAIDLLSGKFEDYERERRKKHKTIKDLKSEVILTSLLKTSKINTIIRKSTRVEVVY